MKTHFKSLIAIPAFMLCSIANAQWTTLSFPSTKTLDRAAFPNDMTGYVASTGYDKVWRTNDGGVSWDSVTFAGNITDIEFISADTGFVIVHEGTPYALKTTYNGGDTWTSVPIPIGPFENLQMMHFKNALTGHIATLDNSIIRTTDGGATWNSLTLGAYGYIMDKEDFDSDTLMMTGWDGTFMYRGAIYSSYDGGLNWQAIVHDSTYTNFYGTHFLNATNGYGVYSNGWAPAKTYLSKTTNGGLSWTEIHIDTTLNFQDVFMKNSNEGYLTGATTSMSGAILKTVDGVNWITDYTTPSTIYRFYNNGNILYGIGAGGLVIKKNIMVGIDENELKLDGKIYPNPTTGILNLNFSVSVELNLYDASGKNVLSKKINSNETIDLNYLTNGIYLARVVVGNKIGSVKVVLNK